MKGKRLFQLINNLSRSEKLQLHHRCQLSNDQRFEVLKALLDAETENQDDFISSFEHLMPYFERYPDSEKASRRFADFACKEIENLLIKNYLEEQQPERDYLLANIFNLRTTQPLFVYYHDKAVQSSQTTDVQWMTMELISHQIKWHTKGQLKEDMNMLRNLLKQKYEYANLNYYQQLAQHYSTLSALYLDDSQKDDFFKDLLPEENQLLELKTNSPSKDIAAQFLLALARFNFRNRGKLYDYIEMAGELIAEIQNDSLRLRVQRSLNYLRILAGIHYGDELSSLVRYSNEVVSINQQYQYKDSVSFFLNLLFLLLNKEKKAVYSKRKKFDRFYFDETNDVYPKFINALDAFLNKDMDKALQLLNELSYSQSDYVALWSKLMALKIHTDLGNTRLVKNLIGRANSYLDHHKGKFFTYEVSSEIVKYYKHFLQEKPIAKPNGYFVFFDMLLP
jgi:hypothetical protein